MRFLLYILFCRLGHSECAKPRSVNLAFETVFEFNNETDLMFVDRVRDFLTSIKRTVGHTDRDIDFQTRRFDSLSFTQFIEDSINVLKSYNDLDLAYFIELLDTEINEHDYRNCEVKITDKFSLRSYFANKLSDARDLPVAEIRRSLDTILRELRSKREHRRRIYNFLNSLAKRRTQERFRSILNYLQLYRRRQMEPTITLRTVVENSIRSLIKDFICNLNYSSWRKLRNMIKMLNDESNSHKKHSENDYKWYPGDKKTMEENDELYDIEILKDVYGSSKRGVNRNTKKHKYQIDSKKNIRNQNHEYKVQDRKEEIPKRKGKVNISLTNSEDVLDLKIDYEEDQAYSNDKPIKTYYDVTTKKIIKIKTKRTLKPKETENESSLSKNYNSDDSNDSNQDRSSVFESSTLTTTLVHRAKKHKRHRTFVTLYPEIISYMTRSNTKNKKATTKKKISNRNKQSNNYEDRQTEKKTERSEEITTEHLIRIIDSNTSIDLDKSLKRKQTHTPNSYKKRFRIKSNQSTSKHKENKMVKINKPTESGESEETSKNSKVDHFGSLYKLKNQDTPEMVYRGFRKSNDLAALATKADTTVNENNTYTTRTYGTLAFWRGTNIIRNSTTKSTIDKEPAMAEKLVTIRNSTDSVPSSIKTTSLYAKSTAIVYKNQTSGLKHPHNDTKIYITRPTADSNNNTKLPVPTMRSLQTTENTEIIKQVDLRRFLNNSILNEVDADIKTKKINEQFQEDLKKIFLVPPLKIPNLNDTNKDPIDEIEEAFNI